MLKKHPLWSALITALCVLTLAAGGAAVDVGDVVIAGKIVDANGSPVRGATVTLIDEDLGATVSVYSQVDGTFSLPAVPARDYQLRSRLIGLDDAVQWVEAGKKQAYELTMAPASNLDAQRPGYDRLAQLKFDDPEDGMNFRMMCTYCHQVGTDGFRSPEEPVDWEVMVTRMDGYQGLYKHTQEAIVDKLVSTYGPGAETTWADYQVPEAPDGEVLAAKVYEWSMGKENDAMIHDLEVGADGKVYIVDMTSDVIEEIDPATGERKLHSFPGGKDYYSTDPPIKGPHSIERAPNGDMWITLALSGEMAKFVPSTGEFTIVSGNEAGKRRGAYPHTLRVDPNNSMVWWTDAGLGVFSMNPENYEVKFYRLPSADQVQGGGRGESRGVTPYGIDIAPDGKVWYTKLNGQRVGRVDPSKADGDPEQIKEWQPPVVGPRRLHVAADGLVWVPGWASGQLASFDEAKDEWKVFELPHGVNSMPYALNIHPTTGEIWVCGTGSDSMLRFDPKTETFKEYRMPTRVTYTREIEFDDEGNVWVSNSNYPVRHVENGRGSVIKLTYGGE